MAFDVGIVHGTYEEVGQIGSASYGANELFKVHAFMYSCKIFLLNVFHAELGAHKDENFVNEFVFYYIL